MVPLNTGDKAPDFSVMDDQGALISLAALRGQHVVLFFYPKDNTPGCTMEAKDFRDAQGAFTAKNTVVFGVSKCSQSSHLRFKEGCGLPFSLLVDTDAQLCQRYGVLAEKTFFGKKYLGIVRTTYLIDPQGYIQKIWSPVTIKGHVASVLSAIDSDKAVS